MLSISLCLSGCKTGKKDAEINTTDNIDRAISAEIKSISLERVLEIIDNSENYTILDVRNLEEYVDGHLDESISIPVQELGKRLAELSADMHLIIYGGEKEESLEAAKILVKNGFEFVYDMGSIIDWKNKGYPLVFDVIMEPLDDEEEPKEKTGGPQDEKSESTQEKHGEYKIITVDESFDFFGNENYLFLDVRSEGEYNEAHVKGAMNIPVINLKDRISEIPADRKIIVYCGGTGCDLSGWAADLLVEAGFKEVYDMKGGGIYEWIDKGYPVEK